MKSTLISLLLITIIGTSAYYLLYTNNEGTNSPSQLPNAGPAREQNPTTPFLNENPPTEKEPDLLEGEKETQTLVLQMGERENILLLPIGAIKLLEVIEDRRCPLWVQCINDGLVVARVQYTESNHATVFEVGLNETPVMVGFETSNIPAFELALTKVEPHKLEETQTISESEYTLTFEATLPE